jgi:hypothetical protein
VVVNPLVNWLWFGFGMLAFASVALYRRGAFAFADAKGAGRRGASLLLLALVLAVGCSWQRPLLAASSEPRNESAARSCARAAAVAR